MANFIFFGSSRLSVIVLNELKKLGLVPALIVTTPDKPQGRKLVVTPNVVKTYALENNIDVITPTKFDNSTIEILNSTEADFFLVASFGKILPKAIIDIPPKGTLNIHPSLLPKYRGPSPLQTAMLDDDKKTGVSIILLDEQMDHGPIIAQKQVQISEWPTYDEFEEMMAVEGARLLAEVISGYISGSIKPTEQDHSAATYTKKISKEDALIDLSTNAYDNFRKIQAYMTSPQAYFEFGISNRKIRVKITKVKFENSALIIEKVIPEGKKEMTYKDFLSGFK